jgi:GNAT superfamily N-acetyltransferase
MAATADAEIRLLTPGDLDQAFALSSTAGWNQRLEDWRFLLQLAPGGGFAAASSGRIIGTAIGIDYGTFGWIAMMLVDPAFRGRGVGACLLEAAMAAIPGDLPIRLDATPLGRPLYQRYGFEDETVLTRHAADAASLAAQVSPGDRRGSIRPLVETDLTHLAPYDREVFGGTRHAMLDWALRGTQAYARIVDDGDVPQYCLGRDGRLFDQIGPVVASGSEAAEALVDDALRGAPGRAVIVDAFDAQTRFTSWLRERGFAPQRPLFRMCRPGASPVARRDDTTVGLVEFAILGPEFA